ncbi:hypothetical protein LB521_27845 [Mesorhizobium sp. BR-1-1-8]|uniref:hypothetical protein n=1 Tax=unclassified Mesorhizobium TaxID=325217 RepID=UPI001CCF79A7|nr:MULTISPECIES: hypothetical protein [unclassified Mesorhizobium]MBZ9973490.1 hypothetical protein [Mesorhizobium sp. BR1-1-12]MBZ9984951.1 hypothetical protein [Mesorhizobium sp. BR-1-1-8]
MAALHHNCCGGKDCYIDKFHPKLEDFDECLPGGCEYTDIDAMVEKAGFFLFTEFKVAVNKKHDHMAPGGQREAMEKLTKLSPKITVWLVEGNSPQRQCTRLRECKNGVWTEWQAITWDELKQAHRDWFPRCVAEHHERLATR